METSPSDGGPATGGFAIVGGGPATAEEVAAITAALDQVLSAAAPEPPPLSRWRWSGRNRWHADWRDPSAPAHPSRP